MDTAKFRVQVEMLVSVYVDAHNAEEAEEFVLADTERQIGAGIDFVDGGGFVDSIEINDTTLESGQETFQCPNCDAWGYDVKKEFCSICDAEEEDDDVQPEV